MQTIPDCVLANTALSKLGGRVTVMPVTLSKGLEFDAVIIPYADRLEENRRIAYMMTTRALHELHLIKEKKD